MHLALLAAAWLLPAPPATAQPSDSAWSASLELARTQTLQQVSVFQEARLTRPALPAEKKPAASVEAPHPPEADKAQSDGKTRELYAEYGGFNGNRWRLVPDPNPPYSEFTITVDKGDHVKLTLVKHPRIGRGPPNNTGFDIDNILAVVNGRKSRGIHLVFNGLGTETATVEFDAENPGLHLIYSRYGGAVGHFGRLIIRDKK